MAEEYGKEERSYLVPFLLGAAIGAGLGVLFAPKSGKELRQDIQDLAGQARDQAYDVIDKSREFYDDKKTALANAIEAGKQAYFQERDKENAAA